LVLSTSLLAQQAVRPFGPERSCCLRHIDRDIPTYIAPPHQLASRTATASFQVTFTGGAAPEVQNAFSYATDIWACLLASDVPIRVQVIFTGLAGGPLGTALANAVRDFPGAPVADTWYPSALADAIAGTDLQPGATENDMLIFMNAGANWYFGTDGNVPSGQLDFVSVALHELGHGLGFTSLAKAEAGQGSFGEITAADFMLPLVPFPPLEGKPGILDRHMIHGPSGLHLTDTSLFANPSPQLASFFTGGEIFLTGSTLLANNNNQSAKLYAPAMFSLGTSVTHLDEALFSPGDTNSLMSPFIANMEVNHHPGPIVLGYLQDIGWPQPGVSIDADVDPLAFSLHPNPSSNYFRWEWDARGSEVASLVIVDQQGKKVWQKKWEHAQGHIEWQPGEAIPAGIYFFHLQRGRKRGAGKILYLK
jgi:hypothetical protein